MSAASQTLAQGAPVLPRGRLVLPQLQHPQLCLARPVLQVPGAPWRLSAATMRRSLALRPSRSPAALWRHGGRLTSCLCTVCAEQRLLPETAAFEPQPWQDEAAVAWRPAFYCFCCFTAPRALLARFVDVPACVLFEPRRRLSL